MLCPRDYHRKTPYNNETKDQLWMSILSDSHDIHCGCPTPFAHLLSLIFPIGHTDRNKTINQILWRDFKELCHSGGNAAAASSGQGEDTKEKPIEEEGALYIRDEDLANLTEKEDAVAGTR